MRLHPRTAVGHRRFAVTAFAGVVLGAAGPACGEKDEPAVATTPTVPTATAPTTTAPAAPAQTTKAPAKKPAR